jgi:hypothetical protein
MRRVAVLLSLLVSGCNGGFALSRVANAQTPRRYQGAGYQNPLLEARHS